MARVHSLWTPKNKFETFLKLPKRIFMNNNKTLGIGEDKTKGMALMKPIPAPREVIRDIDGTMRPIPSTLRPNSDNDNVIVPPNITPVYDPIEFPDDEPYIEPFTIPPDNVSAFKRYDGDLRVDDVNRDFEYPLPPPPLSPTMHLPEVPTHIPRHPTPPPEYEDEADIATRRENKNHNRILRKLKTAPKPPTDSPTVSEDEDEDEFVDAMEPDDEMSWNEAESYVDNSSTNNFVESVEDIVKMIAHLSSIVQEKLSSPFKNSLIYNQIQNFILYLVNNRPDVLIDNRIDRNYSQIYTYDKEGNLRKTGESILYLIYNMLDNTKRAIKPLDELRGSVVFESYDQTFSAYYNGIANMNMSDYFEADYLPHLKLLVQQFNDSRDRSYYQDMVFRSYKDPSAEAYRESRKLNGPLVFFMDELSSFNQQVDNDFRLRVGVKETPQLINVTELVRDIYEDNLYAARFLYDFFFKRIFKETAEGKGSDGLSNRTSYRESLMDMIKDFNIGGMPAKRVIEQITRSYERGSVHNILPHEDIMVIADCFIDAFYKHLICIPFGVQVPVELIKIIDEYRYLYDSFKSQWENNYNGMTTASRALARYFALNFLFIFYTYGVSVVNGDMINEDVYDQRGETLNNMSLSDYTAAVLKNLNQSISEFDFDREQSFFASLNEFRTTLGGLYMERVLVKKRPSSPIIITEDYKPYVTLDEAREKEREERMSREQRRFDEMRQEEYEKELEARERALIRERERERAEARALANAKFEEQRRSHETAVENERVRIERLDAEREEVIKRSVEEQIKVHGEQERQWRNVNENISKLERAQDLLDEEEVEQNLEWDDYTHITDDEDIVDGASGIDPLYGLNALEDDVKPIDTDNKTGRKLVYRWGDMTPPPTDTSLDTRKGVKRSAKKSLHSLHVRKTLRRDSSSDDSNISDIDDFDPNMDFLTDLSSGEENRVVNRRVPRRNKTRVKRPIIPTGSKRLNDSDSRLSPSAKVREKMRLTANRRARRFVPIRELPSQQSFVRGDEDISKRFMSDVSDEVDEMDDPEDDNVNPALRQLKSQMENYRNEILTDDEDFESSDADEW